MADEDETVFEPENIKKAEPVADPVVEVSPPKKTGGHKILIIDDDEGVRRSIVRCLSTMNVEILEAGDGKEGVALLAKSSDVVLLITDVVMPNLDGLKLIEQLRSTEAFGKLKIMIVSGHASPAKLQKAKELNIEGWINKPFNADRLVAAVGQVLVKIS
jgi:two-component system, chemotaxis family, chemotaxis protein CheY